MSAERRRHPRYELLAQVRVKRSKSDLMMTLTNISRSGALVDMGSLDAPAWIDIGRVLEIGIVHPETLDTIDVRATVVRLTRDLSGTSFAVQFADPDDEGLVALLEHAVCSCPPPKGPPPLPT